jgi:UDP-N-acetylglucosamine--N-acetylmuramyl-(pentapeptide) pyrophosphoryl-undecaprenol N-acetylglucosamine transferase
MIKNNLLISTGKTGGHILPALIVVQKYLENNIDIKVVIVCFSKDLFENNIKSGNVEYVVLNDWKPSNIKAILTNTFKIIHIIKQFEIKKVLIFGSYLSVPVIFASAILKIDLFLHEQNILPGKANRIAQIFAKKIFISYSVSTKYLLKSSRKKVVITGSLIRKISVNPNNVVNNQVLIMGGSQGAKSINNFILSNLSKIESSNISYKVITGEKNYSEFIKSIDRKPMNLEIINFTNDILSLMSSSRLIVSRAGANTLSEISYLGKPSIMIPFPYASENHQQLNAEYFEANNASIIIKDADLCKKESFEMILSLMKNETELKKMGDNANILYTPYAEEKIVDILC